MPNLHVVSEDALPAVEAPFSSFSLKVFLQWSVGILAAFALGTWLVWWSALVQRTFTMEEIRSACQRVMSESVERCIDTVTIQRGGARR